MSYEDSASAAAGQPAHPAGAVDNQRIPAETIALLSALIGAAFIVILNETVLSVALPRLMVVFAVPATTAQWLTTGFMLTMAVVIPTTGFILDRFPHRTVFAVAMALFAAGSATAAAAPVFAVLLTGRVLQASGTALIMPLLMTTILRTIPPSRRGSVMGMVTVVISVAPALGPTTSGLILSVTSWHWLFIPMVGISLIALIIGLRLMPKTSPLTKTPLDIISIPLAAVGFGGVIYGLSQIGAHAGSGSLLGPIGILIVGVVVLAGFIIRQRLLLPQGRALLNLTPLKDATYTQALIIMVTAMGVQFGALILLPIYLTNATAWSTLKIGLVMMPGSLLMGMISPSIGAAYDRLGARPLVIPGTICLATGSSILAWSTAQPMGAPIWGVLLALMVLFGGLALLMTPLMTAALSQLPMELHSHGSALLSTLQQLAGAAGSALFVTLMAATSAGVTGTGLQGPEATGAPIAFLVAACAGVATAVVAVFATRKFPRPAAAE